MPKGQIKKSKEPLLACGPQFADHCFKGYMHRYYKINIQIISCSPYLDESMLSLRWISTQQTPSKKFEKHVSRQQKVSDVAERRHPLHELSPVDFPISCDPTNYESASYS